MSSAHIESAYVVAARALKGELRGGHWTGELSASALATATAVSALAIVSRAGRRETKLEACLTGGVQSLLQSQRDDGGWGDTDRSYSNVATTYLSLAALHLAGAAEVHGAAVAKANAYLEAQGGRAALLRRYGTDKTFVIPILTNCALAGLVPWSDVEALPFELACVPQAWYRLVGMPVVSYAIPALIAIGQAHFTHAPPWNPLLRSLRSACVEPSLRVLETMQPTSGGYLEATPLTSFVVMSLAASGRSDHAVVQRGVQFLLDSARFAEDERGSATWPIDTNLATWVTTLSLQALAASEENCTDSVELDWLLGCQHLRRHPFTGADPGGWGWTDLSGAVPDADDTPGAILALQAWLAAPACRAGDRAMIRAAIASGVAWLLDLQNRDGGWPTFCRGWGRLPFDRSGVDLTAHVIRALLAVYGCDVQYATQGERRKVGEAIARGLAFVEARQRSSGGWSPLWFGNQDAAEEENLVYGTAKVLLAYEAAHRGASPPAQRGRAYLLASQNADGGWGGGPAMRAGHVARGQTSWTSSVEETALAVEALLAFPDSQEGSREALHRGVAWLCRAVENTMLFDSAPIGLYFAKLWYYERLYPLVFTVAALGKARRRLAP